jgi:hypothetical protein
MARKDRRPRVDRVQRRAPRNTLVIVMAGALGCQAARGSGCAKNSYRRFYSAAKASHTGSCKAQTALGKAFPTPKAYHSLSPQVGIEEGFLQEYLWFLRATYRKA